MQPRATHDHIVLLLEKRDFENPPAWLTDSFTIIEGGAHAGGSSRNKLIIFEDGTYLELFTWITEPKEFLAWADKPAGLIDFALTTLDPVTVKDNYDSITAALQQSEQASTLGIKYSAPQAGGRTRMDGVDIKWETTRPQFGAFADPPEDKYLKNTRLDAPFFCHDVTDRTARVPFTERNSTQHACGAIGILSVNVLVPRSHIEAYLAFHRALLGTKETWYTDEKHGEYAAFQVGVPNPGSRGHESYIRVYCPPQTRTSCGGEQENWLIERGPGIYGLVLRGKGETSEHDIGVLGRDEIGTSISLQS